MPRQTPLKIPAVDPGRMAKHWRVLCEEIGERRAGSKGEKAAADYLVKTFQELGLASVRAEEFPCVTLESSRVTLKVKTDAGWRDVPARALVGALATDGDHEIVAELVWVEMPER